MDYVARFWQPAVSVNANLEDVSIKINHNEILLKTVLVGSCCLGMALTAPPSLILLSCVVVAPGCFVAFENYHATQKCHEIAVKFFMEKEYVPESIMDYMCRNPDAVSLLVKQKEVNLEKQSSIHGKSLKEEALIYFCSKYFSFKDTQELVKLLDEKKIFNKNDFVKCLSNEDLSLEKAKFLLSLSSLKVEDFSESDLACCYNQTKDAHILEEMHRKGFKLDVQDAFLSSIVQQEWGKVAVFIQAGSQMPDIKQQVNLFRNSKIEKKTLEVFLNENPLVKLKLETMLKNTALPLPKIAASPFAFWKPAVKIDGDAAILEACEMDINLRTFIVAYPLLFGSVIGSIISPTPIFLLSLPIIYFYHKWEWSRATRVLNEVAISQFNSALPAKGVVEYVVKHSDIELIDQLGNNLTKISEDGNDLYQEITKGAFRYITEDSTRLPIFKKIADAFFTKELSVESKLKYLLRTLKSKHQFIEFITYLLDTKVKASDFSEQQQHEIFMKARNAQAIKLLTQRGFNINAKNNKGETALQLAIKHPSYRIDFPPFHQVRSLVLNGAKFDEEMISSCQDEVVKGFMQTHLK